jgi:hypothetical protein
VGRGGDATTEEPMIRSDDTRTPDDDGPRRPVVGPPGWEEFAAARRRFFVSMAIEGLERAYSAAEDGSDPGADGL